MVVAHANDGVRGQVTRDYNGVGRRVAHIYRGDSVWRVVVGFGGYDVMKVVVSSARWLVLVAAKVVVA